MIKQAILFGDNCICLITYAGGVAMARILVVDDAMFMRLILKSILTEAGHTIAAEAADGEAAIREYKKHMPDLVTMDITMPGLTGIDAVKGIINVNPQAKIIMVSAVPQKDHVIQAIKNGAKSFIIKPITVDKLIEVVDSVLGYKTQRSMSRDRVDGISKSIKNLYGSAMKEIDDSINTLEAMENE